MKIIIILWDTKQPVKCPNPGFVNDHNWQAVPQKVCFYKSYSRSRTFIPYEGHQIRSGKPSWKNRQKKTKRKPN